MDVKNKTPDHITTPPHKAFQTHRQRRCDRAMQWKPSERTVNVAVTNTMQWKENVAYAKAKYLIQTKKQQTNYVSCDCYSTTSSKCLPTIISRRMVKSGTTQPQHTRSRQFAKLRNSRSDIDDHNESKTKSSLYKQSTQDSH